MNRLSIYCLISAIVLCNHVKSVASIVVPGANAIVEGNGNNGYPFNITAHGVLSMRYQQAYAASEFGSTPVVITQILFRPDSFGDAFNTVLTSVQINLSTTTQAIDGLSSTFANNVGSDDTIVVPQGPLALASSDTAGAGNTRAFDIVIDLVTPFLYDPAQGNLLLDVRNFGGGTTTQFDAASFLNDSVSRGWSGSVNSSTASQDTGGLVTAFTLGSTSVVPEPATLFVWSGLGLAVAGSVYAKKRKAAQQNA